jgi:hypothetical protein
VWTIIVVVGVILPIAPMERRGIPESIDRRRM